MTEYMANRRTALEKSIRGPKRFKYETHHNNAFEG